MSSKTFKQTESVFDPSQNAAANILSMAKEMSKKRFPIKTSESSKSAPNTEEQPDESKLPRISLQTFSLETLHETGLTGSTVHEGSSQSSRDSCVSSPAKNSSNIEDKQLFSKARTSLDLIHAMLRLHCQREKELEEEHELYCSALQANVSQLTDATVLERRLTKLRNLHLHLKKIMEESAQLRQKLKNPMLNDVWDVHISHHRDIVEFFDSAKRLLLQLETNAEAVTWNSGRTLRDDMNLEQCLAKIDIAVSELQRNLDSLIKFREGVNNLYYPTV